MTKEQPSILIIDDDKSILARISTLLCDDFQCYTATTAEQGLTVFNSIAHLNPLIICDVNLPDGTGFDVCKIVKSQFPKIPVIFLTGFNSKELRMKGLSVYADNCLDKTMDDAELKLLIRNAFNTAQPYADISRPAGLILSKSEGVQTDFESEVVSYILAYYKKPLAERRNKELSLKAISAHFNLTQRTFQRKIKLIAASSYIKYLTRIKLDQSKELLATNFSVTEISEILGYSSPSHYSREFKKCTNMTPNKFKQINEILR